MTTQTISLIAWSNIIWVKYPVHRKQGLGAKLLQEIEQIAIEKNCTLVHLDIFDFQAKDFYVKQDVVESDIEPICISFREKVITFEYEAYSDAKMVFHHFKEK